MSGQSGPPYWVQKNNEAILWADRESQRLKLQDRIKELEAENSRLKTRVGPMCKCLSCGSEFTRQPHLNQESVAGYAERLTKVICFKCGADSGRLTITS